jgi:uncharacterized protein YegJ (DUF2314 family)
MKEPQSNILGICPDCASNRLASFQSKPAPDYQIGGFVKTALTSPERTEHVWVKIEKINKDTITGALNNDPIFFEVKCGDKLIVDKNQISDYIQA